MNLLFSNDQPGQYPGSWYAATALDLAPYAPLRGETRADVCVVGAGYTGLSAALHLAEAGLDVVVLDAHRVGFGASGRNGGQLGSGQRVDQVSLESMVGSDAARVLWQLGQDAKALVRTLTTKYDIDCYLRDGIAWSAERKADMDDLKTYAAHMERHYGYDCIEVAESEAFAELCPSPAYVGGIVDWGAGHLHPLRLAQGLAAAAQGQGARIHEKTLVHDVDASAGLVRADRGVVRADHIILAGNGYLGGLNREVAARVMPINNFIVATEPLGDRMQDVLRQDIAVADSRFVINYFRPSHDGRLLFGGGESYGYRFPRDIAATVRKPMLEIFPSLRDSRIDYAWGGTLAITMKRLPYLARLAPNMLSASGYSGHGVGTAVHAGRLMAEAIRGQSAGFDAMAAIPAARFPGGPAFRSPLLALAMTWFALRDRLGV